MSEQRRDWAHSFVFIFSKANKQSLMASDAAVANLE
jgi:hypothetical protein